MRKVQEKKEEKKDRILRSRDFRLFVASSDRSSPVEIVSMHFHRPRTSLSDAFVGKNETKQSATQGQPEEKCIEMRMHNARV